MKFLILLAQLAVFAVNMNRYVVRHQSSEEDFPLLFHKKMYFFNTINISTNYVYLNISFLNEVLRFP
jgi:hypothetical protein